MNETDMPSSSMDLADHPLMPHLSRIRTFEAKSPYSIQEAQSKRRRYIPLSPEKILDAPAILEDFYLNVLDWGNDNILAVALDSTVYLWDDNEWSPSQLMTADMNAGPVTSVAWAIDGRHLAVGLNNSEVQIWDASTFSLLRTLRGGHLCRAGSLSWNDHILTVGSMDSRITNNDVRVKSHLINTYRGHREEVCGLKWSTFGGQLASGGNDNLVHIWELRQNSYVHRFEEHTAAVKALAWCPFQSNMLASGGGWLDKSIKFWNMHTGLCLKSVDTESQVCSLLWSKSERELLSSHGLNQNQLTLWE